MSMLAGNMGEGAKPKGFQTLSTEALHVRQHPKREAHTVCLRLHSLGNQSCCWPSPACPVHRRSSFLGCSRGLSTPGCGGRALWSAGHAHRYVLHLQQQCDCVRP